MSTPRLLFLPLLLLLLPAPAATADGCPSPCSGQSSSPPNVKYLYVQPEGSRGEILAYNTVFGTIAFSLPPGAASSDGRRHVVASPRRVNTQLANFNLRNGLMEFVSYVPGHWRIAGVSPTGKWAALVASRGQKTRIAIVDAQRGTIVHRATLGGRFEVETISRDGKRLFLIEHLQDGRYLVRLYDLTLGRLKTQALKASGEGAPMVGLAWSGVGSPDGRWLLTLYLNTHHNHAFVHALDLQQGKPACIDLPSGNGRMAALKRYTLTLTPNGRTLFAANPALGVVASIDLRTLRVTRAARFAPSPAGRPTRQLSAGTISRDGRTLYFSAGSGLWAYDAAYGRVRGPYATGGRIVGFGYGPGDRTIHALRADGKMLRFDAATGRRL
jgi:hypothetical protein